MPEAAERVQLGETPIYLRHIKRGLSTDPGAVQVLGKWFTPQPMMALNGGDSGFQSGSYERRLNEEGTIDLRLPNTAGPDGKLHRKRFAVNNQDDYRMGEEWIEVWEENSPEPLFVATPSAYSITPQEFRITGYDGLILSKKSRESAAGFFANAPRDVFEHYTRLSQLVAGSDFDTETFTFSTSQQTDATGVWAYQRVQQGASYPSKARLTGAQPTSTVQATDNFTTGADANLNGRTSTTGGLVWSTSDPWSVLAATGVASLPVSNNNKYARLGSGSVVNIDVQANCNAPGSAESAGITARYQDSQNHVVLYVSYYGDILLGKRRGNVLTTLGASWGPASSNRLLRLRIDSTGAYAAYVDGSSTPLFQGTDPDFATGGALATGGFGIYGSTSPSSGSAVTVDNYQQSTFTSADGYIQSVQTIPMGTSDPHTPWRAEASFTRVETWTDDQDYAELSVGPVAMRAYSNKIVCVGATQRVVAASGTSYVQPGDHQLAIEGRDRWVVFYFDGKVVKILPITTGTASAPVRFGVAKGTGTTVASADLGMLAFRRWTDALMRGADKGDYRLPGAPTADGILGEYYDDAAVAAGGYSDTYLEILNPSLSPYARRIDKSIMFWSSWNAAPLWQPVGPYNGTNFSARWSGSAKLPLSQYDFKFRLRNDARSRMWLGKTRVGEELINAWGSTAVNDPTASTTSALLRSIFGSTTDADGWYPIIVEMNNGGGAAGVILEYERQDQTGLWVGPGTPAYPHAVRADAPSAYYRFDDAPQTSGGQVKDHSGSNIDGGFYSGGSHQVCQPSMLNGDTCFAFDGDDYVQVASTGALNMTTGVTLEALAKPAEITSTRTIVRKEAQYILRFSSGNAEFWTNSGGTWRSVTTPAVANEWHHYVGTYDGSNMRIYVDGVLKNTTAATGAISTGTNPFYIGGWLSAGILTEPFNGLIDEVAIYVGALSQAQITAHYNAITSAPIVPLSTQGIFKDQVRYESAYDQLVNLKDSFGYQFEVQPKSLESGEFPCRIAPRLRVGRDTDHVLKLPEAVDLQVDGNAEDLADTLLSDAQGLADPSNSAQLSAEVFAFPLLADQLMMQSEFESSPDIAVKPLLLQRLESLLALRSSVWEQVAVRPNQLKHFVDKFPLTGALAEFAWGPGDGARIDIPEVAVQDTSARQILGVQYPFVPSGRQAPTVAFRARPRSLRDTLRKMLHATLRDQRNYQGQLITVTGGLGSNANNGTPTGGAQDLYSRVGAPPSTDDIVKAEFIVTYGDNATTYAIYVNNVDTGLRFTQPGRYDITPFVKRDGAAQGSQRFYAHAVLVSGSGSAEYYIEMLTKK